MTAWEKVPQRVRDWVGLIGVVAALVGGAFGLGAATTERAKEMRELPKRVETLETRFDSVVADVGDVKAIQVETRCILRAMALEEDAKDCLPLFVAGGG